MNISVESIEALKSQEIQLLEVELMLTSSELQSYANFCKENDIKFNDWIRHLAKVALDNSKS